MTEQAWTPGGPKSVAEVPWRLLPVLVLRSAGFPWQLVEGLAHHACAEVLGEILEVTRSAHAHGATLRPVGNLSRGLKSKVRNLRPLPPSEAIDEAWRQEWNRLTEHLAALTERAELANQADRDRVDAEIDRIRLDPRFGDAVVCSSPSVYRDLGRGAKGSRLRRQIASYAQRLATKSETMSFFGPINYATVSPEVPGPSTWTWSGHRAIPARQAHVAARVHDAIAAAVLADDERVGGLVPRRKTALRPVRVSDPRSALIDAVDGEATVAELARRLGLDLDRVVAEFRAAVAAGRLTHDLAAPATEVDPLRWLRSRVDGPVLDLVDRVLALLADYPDADPDRKRGIQDEIQAVVPPTAGPASTSRFYNDRVIVHEAAVGTVEMSLRGELAADLTTAVAPVLDLLAHEAELTTRLTNRALARRLGPGRFPLTSVLRSGADLDIVPGTWLAEAVDIDPDAPVLDLAGLVPPTRGTEPVLCSIDVLVATPDPADYRPGVTPVVLGDIHDAALLTPWALQFHPDRDRVLRERDKAIVETLDGRTVLNVVSRRTTGLPPLEFPGIVLELGGGASAGRTAIGLDQLVVHSDGERAVLRSPELPGRELALHNGELDSGVHTALALPRIRRPRLPDAPHLPRITWGNVVLSRRRWTVASEAVLAVLGQAGELDRLRDMRFLAAEHGFPGRVFAKSPNERKPVYVDLASPDLLKGLERLAATAAELVFSEVLPAPEDAWLRDGDLRFPSEFRCVYLRSGRPRAEVAG
ncbi:hypothetical protein V5P93_003438 [Actinokineospora auranticolor]|uniref:Lantibiotic biosynthesis dehydratase-like protein n=1 Tax=Actinokineospora auranticolor TaxID=155976 RepID=A0A2S6GPF3_9PSEU|nr:lantibiotic dehydratase [Actinokineospora auranticolor]PPK67099.1 lantibiotic biosynthesis dehydratase-like protein [Actinokineospora auranticolor]